MSVNLQTFTEKLSTKLDEKHLQDKVTGFLSGGSLEAEFASADTVLVPEYDMSGLADYSRHAGFAKGGIAMRKKAYTLPMERGRKFSIDIRDIKTNDIKDAVKSLADMIKEFQRTKVDTEVDAYNLSTIGANATAFNRTKETFTASSTDVLKRLLYDIEKAAEMANGEELFAFVNWGITGLLSSSAEFEKRIDIANFKKGNIDTQLKTINDCGLVKAPRARMATAYNFFNGVDTEQKPGGFAPTADAGTYNWIILPKSAANCISVLEKSQIITPEQNSEGLMYSQGYRRLYGAFVTNNNKERIVVSHN